MVWQAGEGAEAGGAASQGFGPYVGPQAGHADVNHAVIASTVWSIFHVAGIAATGGQVETTCSAFIPAYVVVKLLNDELLLGDDALDQVTN